ncbi:DUF3017 domain-containing protein [Streptosporangium sp. NPDC051023]|uniref:DUF3017 domain-containing protein n=1 Tax=Streptosporangium sp. NPDC051023 TaxID=3155410 RepID=UPI00344C81FC
MDASDEPDVREHGDTGGRRARHSQERTVNAASATSAAGNRWGPYPLVLAGAILAVIFAVLVDPEWGGFSLGAVMALGALFRLTGGGQLAVRRKTTDTVTLALFGVALMVGSLLLQYPWLMPRYGG